MPLTCTLTVEKFTLYPVVHIINVNFLFNFFPRNAINKVPSSEWTFWPGVNQILVWHPENSLLLPLLKWLRINFIDSPKVDFYMYVIQLIIFIIVIFCRWGLLKECFRPEHFTSWIKLIKIFWGKVCCFCCYQRQEREWFILFPNTEERDIENIMHNKVFLTNFKVFRMWWSTLSSI